MTESKYRLCNTCKQEKPLTEFYERQTRCKPCMYLVNKERGRQKSPRAKLDTIFGSEGMVINELRKRGIPAYPGKSVSYAHVDVVAWGCVGIEVKSSRYDGGYQWGFSSRQRAELQSDVIVLVTLDDEPQFYVFPSNHPVFYRDGRRKSGVTYLPYEHAQKRKDIRPMLIEDMEQARGRWELVQTCRNEFSHALMNGVTLPNWLR